MSGLFSSLQNMLPEQMQLGYGVQPAQPPNPMGGPALPQGMDPKALEVLKYVLANQSQMGPQQFDQQGYDQETSQMAQAMRERVEQENIRSRNQALVGAGTSLLGSIGRPAEGLAAAGNAIAGGAPSPTPDLEVAQFEAQRAAEGRDAASKDFSQRLAQLNVDRQGDPTLQGLSGAQNAFGPSSQERIYDAQQDARLAGVDRLLETGNIDETQAEYMRAAVPGSEHAWSTLISNIGGLDPAMQQQLNERYKYMGGGWMLEMQGGQPVGFLELTSGSDDKLRRIGQTLGTASLGVQRLDKLSPGSPGSKFLGTEPVPGAADAMIPGLARSTEEVLREIAGVIQGSGGGSGGGIRRYDLNGQQIGGDGGDGGDPRRTGTGYFTEEDAYRAVEAYRLSIPGPVAPSFEDYLKHLEETGGFAVDPADKILLKDAWDVYPEAGR